MTTLNKILLDLKSSKISQRQFIALCKDEFIYDDVLKQTSFLDEYNPSLLERLYYIINDLHETVRCKYCDNKAIWTNRLKDGYKEICSSDECRRHQLSDTHKDKQTISDHRDSSFIESQSHITEVNDTIIKDLIKYDKFVPLITNPIILNYLDNRYKNSSSRLETVQRIRLGIDEKPKCPVCGNPVQWVGKKSKLYTEYCSNTCRAHSYKTKEKMKQTQSERAELYKEKIREQYGVDFLCQTDVFKEKRKQTLIKRYGTTKLYQVKEIRDKIADSNLKRFGYDCAFKSPDIRKKMYETCKVNGKLKSSKAEDRIYEWLVELGYNVERFYRSDAFPFTSDFYLTDYDIYIEFQGSQFHNGRAFLGTKEDIEEVNRLKEKNEELIKGTNKKKSQYQSIIDTWTVFDVKKRNYAKEYQLKYLEIYDCTSIGDLKHQLDIFLFMISGNMPGYKDEQLRNEFKYYKRLKCDYLQQNIGWHNMIVKHFQCRTFFKKEIDLFVNDPVLRRKLIQNRLKYLGKSENELTVDDILTGFKKSGIYYGYSHFNPAWTNWFVHKYGIKRIYDPCGGWGHHLLGMLDCDKIIYNDFSEKTVDNVRMMKDYFRIDNLDVHYGDACEYAPEDVDAWFMCPPYFNVEDYECGGFKDIDEYRDFLGKIFEMWRRSSANLFGVILRDDLKELIKEEPFEVYELNVKSSHLTRDKKFSEKFYMFKKNSQ